MQCIRFSVLLNAFCPSCLLLREESERSHGRIISFSATFALRPLHMAVHFHPVIRFWQTLPLLSSSDLNKSIDFYAYYRSTVTKLLDLPKHWKRCPVLDQIIALVDGVFFPNRDLSFSNSVGGVKWSNLYDGNLK